MMTTFTSLLIPLIRFAKQYGVSISFLFLLVITILSFIPVTEEPPINGVDKIEHLIAYSALTLPASLAYHPRTKHIFWFACIWGMMIEIIQPYFGRQADTIDAVINVLGAGIGIALSGYLIKLLCTDPLPSDE